MIPNINFIVTDLDKMTDHKFQLASIKVELEESELFKRVSWPQRRI